MLLRNIETDLPDRTALHARRKLYPFSNRLSLHVGMRNCSQSQINLVRYARNEVETSDGGRRGKWQEQ
jgi:hypothetical protein